LQLPLETGDIALPSTSTRWSGKATGSAVEECAEQVEVER